MKNNKIKEKKQKNKKSEKKFKKRWQNLNIEKQRKCKATPRGVSKKSEKKLLTFNNEFVILMEQLARRAKKNSERKLCKTINKIKSKSCWH